MMVAVVVWQLLVGCCSQAAPPRWRAAGAMDSEAKHHFHLPLEHPQGETPHRYSVRKIEEAPS